MATREQLLDRAATAEIDALHARQAALGAQNPSDREFATQESNRLYALAASLRQQAKLAGTLA